MDIKKYNTIENIIVANILLFLIGEKIKTKYLNKLTARLVNGSLFALSLYTTSRGFKEIHHYQLKPVYQQCHYLNGPSFERWRYDDKIYLGINVTSVFGIIVGIIGLIQSASLIPFSLNSLRSRFLL
jgi:hypothetical protein